MSNLNVRIVGEKLTLFWEESLSGGAKKIVIERPNLSTENKGGSARNNQDGYRVRGHK